MDLLIDLFWMAMEGGKRSDLAFPDAVRLNCTAWLGMARHGMI